MCFLYIVDFNQTSGDKKKPESNLKTANPIPYTREYLRDRRGEALEIGVD